MGVVPGQSIYEYILYCFDLEDGSDELRMVGEVEIQAFITDGVGLALCLPQDITAVVAHDGSS